MAVAVGLAAVAIGIGVSSRAPLRFVTTAGLATGDGRTTAPFDMSVHGDTTITGDGKPASPLSADTTAIQAFTFFQFGDGSDGDCNWDGATTVVGDSPAAIDATETAQTGATTTYVVSGFRFCQDAYVGATVAVNSAWPIYVAGTLSLDGIIHRNGRHPIVNATQPGNYGAGWTTATSNNASSSVGCLRMIDVFYDASTGACSAGITPAAGTGNNGVNGADGTRLGCGGTAGSTCNSNTSGASTPGTFSTGSSLMVIGHSDLWQADGYYDRPFGNTGTMCAGTGGGDGGGGNARGGGGGGHVIVHAKKIVAGALGGIQARGGEGWTNTNTTQCQGGGAGGGGGAVTVYIGGGSFPPISVAGGTGAPGTLCASGACVGLRGGRGGDGREGYTVLYNLGLF